MFVVSLTFWLDSVSYRIQYQVSEHSGFGRDSYESGPKHLYSRQDAKNAKGVGRMTEDEIGKQIIDVETTIDFLALLASWRENLSSSPTNSAEDPNEEAYKRFYPLGIRPNQILDAPSAMASSSSSRLSARFGGGTRPFSSLTDAVTGTRRTVPSGSTAKSNRSPARSLSLSRSGLGIVTCPLLVSVVMVVPERIVLTILCQCIAVPRKTGDDGGNSSSDEVSGLPSTLVDMKPAGEARKALRHVGALPPVGRSTSVIPPAPTLPTALWVGRLRLSLLRRHSPHPCGSVDFGCPSCADTPHIPVGRNSFRLGQFGPKARLKAGVCGTAMMSRFGCGASVRRGLPAVRQSQGPGGSVPNGLTTRTPVCTKCRSLRVTTVRSWIKAVAAICLPNALCG